MYKIIIFTRSDLKIILIGTSLGVIAQYLCWKYVKDHPEILEQLEGGSSEKKELTEKPTKRPFLFDGRGGAMITITGVQIVVNFGKIVIALKEYGTLIFVGTTTAVVLTKKIPTTAVSTIVHYISKRLGEGSIVLNTFLEKRHIIEINSLGECSGDFKYLVSVLSDKEIPYYDRQKKALIILKQQLNDGTTKGLVRFLTCLVAIFVLFTILGDKTSVFLMMQSLLQALRDGKLPKRIARILIRRLIKNNVPVDPELIEAAAY